jgi:hypothetical protein
MAEEIFNITHCLVVQEIESALETYPNHPYQQAFAHPEFRNKLIVHVLNQCRNQFVVLDRSDLQAVNALVSEQIDQEEMDLRSLIDQSINVVLNANADWVNRHIPDGMDAGRATSNQFC